VLVEVAVPAHVHRTFTYAAKDPRALEPGRRLLVPFGRRETVAFSLGAAREAPPGELREVRAVLDEEPVFSPELLSLLRFAADYYLHPLGEAMRAALPPQLLEGKTVGERASFPDRAALALPPEAAREAVRRAPRQAAIVERLVEAGGALDVENLRRELGEVAPLLRALEAKGVVRLSSHPRREPENFGGGPPPEPTPEQAEALRAVEASLGRYQTFLLQGITGSGKTEVYLQAIRAVRARGQGALVLVPEIALTPQLAARFRSRFGDEVAVLHSGLGDAERVREHRRLLRGEAHIALGARSAVFAPVRDLGIVIVDEEHDPSYKQEDRFRYHARDLAVMRARLAEIPCVLGSATPSLESMENARRGKYARLVLSRRLDGRSLPEVEVVDLRQPAETGDAQEPEILSTRLLEELVATLERGEQAILFLNRRGHSPLVLCPTCGERASCPNCDVGLTYHRSTESLRCHYCDLRVRRWERCPSCDEELLILGAGTERLEQCLRERLPRARVARLDRDAASSARRLHRILSAFAAREIDVLVGTQMIAKGHDFPGVTLVGVVLADVGLGLPDFRASERTFQLLTQVAGRAGRGEAAGKVIVQTFRPTADAIAYACRHDPEGFARAELVRRQDHGYPPFRRMLAVHLDGKDAAEVQRQARALGELVRRLATERVTVLGPAPAPIARLRGRSRFQILVLADRASTLQSIGRRLLGALPTARGVRVALDMDPASTL